MAAQAVCMGAPEPSLSPSAAALSPGCDGITGSGRSATGARRPGHVRVLARGAVAEGAGAAKLVDARLGWADGRGVGGGQVYVYVCVRGVGGKGAHSMAWHSQ